MVPPVPPPVPPPPLPDVQPRTPLRIDGTNPVAQTQLPTEEENIWFGSVHVEELAGTQFRIP